MDNEIWKEIRGYEGYFEVSNLGNFRSLDRIIKYKKDGLRLYHGKTLKVEHTEDGYCRIVLMKNAIKKRYMCHRLVAETFIPNEKLKPFVNHINGKRDDNRACNLEWCTQSENEIHSFHVLWNTMKGKTRPRKVIGVKIDNNDIVKFTSMNKAIEYIGIGCIEGLKKSIIAKRSYHGYVWSFHNESSTTIPKGSTLKWVEMGGILNKGLWYSLICIVICSSS